MTRSLVTNIHDLILYQLRIRYDTRISPSNIVLRSTQCRVHLKCIRTSQRLLDPAHVLQKVPGLDPHSLPLKTRNPVSAVILDTDPSIHEVNTTQHRIPLNLLRQHGHTARRIIVLPDLRVTLQRQHQHKTRISRQVIMNVEFKEIVCFSVDSVP